MDNAINDKLRNECQNALDSFEKMNLPETADLQANLSWCIGSYDHDKNPTGLAAFSVQALEALNKIKAKNPRKVSKKLLDGLDAAIRNYEASH
jgi:hypothetical protein